VARGVRRGAPGRPLDDDRDTGQRRALLTGYFSGNGLLLCKSSRSNQEYSHQHHDYAFFHNELYGFWWTVSRAPTARSSTRALTYRGVVKTARGARNTMSPSRLPLATVLAAGLVAACATNPATGARQIMLVSESQEIAMGRDYDRQVVASIGLYPDSGLQRYIQQFGTRLAATSERPDLPWTFRVVDDPVVNAFALPGGFIYVTRGILAHLNSEAELAGVVGHEIGHVTARHSVSQMTKQQLAQLGLAVGAIASPDAGRYAGLASQALGVLFLKYSRDDESQADELGLRYLRRAAYDAREMPHVFEMLARVSQAQGGGRVPEWLATHPDPENRRSRIERDIAAGPQSSAGTAVNRDSYLQRLDGLVFGTNPREGYFKGGEFFHPDLRFWIAFPAGWKTSNEKEAVAAVSPDQDALVELSLAKEASADAAARAFL